MIGQIQNIFTSVNVPLILFCFAFYFLGGFFFYSSLYAAIGSAVNEDMREAQSLSFPITMLVILSIANDVSFNKRPDRAGCCLGKHHSFQFTYRYDGQNTVWRARHCALVATGSFYGIINSGFYFYRLVCGKIYRTGILMYGKKPSWKEMMKWAFQKKLIHFP